MITRSLWVAVAGFTLLAAMPASANDVKGHIRPTPEEQLIAAGIDTSVASLSTTLLDSEVSPDLRYLSAVALGRTEKREVTSTLSQALEDPNIEVRLGALEGLRSVADPRSVPSVRAVLEGDADPRVRKYAVTVLSVFHTEDAADALIATALNAGEQESTRSSAIKALGHFEFPSITLKLRPLLNAPEESLRASSAVALSMFNDRNAIPTLVDLALDQGVTETSRNYALQGLERLTGETFGGYLSAEHSPPTDAERKAAQAKVSAWWEKNRHLYEL